MVACVNVKKWLVGGVRCVRACVCCRPTSSYFDEPHARVRDALVLSFLLLLLLLLLLRAYWSMSRCCRCWQTTLRLCFTSQIATLPTLLTFATSTSSCTSPPVDGGRKSCSRLPSPRCTVAR